MLKYTQNSALIQAQFIATGEQRRGSESILAFEEWVVYHYGRSRNAGKVSLLLEGLY